MTSDGAYLYAGGDDLTAFARNPGTGALAFIDVEPTPVGTSASAVQASPDSSYVYAGVGNFELRVFTRDPGTGTLTFAETFVRNQNGVGRIGEPVVVSPDGRDVYTAGGVGQFRRVSLSCSATPAAGCFGATQPATGVLKLADNADDAKDALTWSWTRGQAVAYADFGNPVDPVTDYALCVYDASGGGTLVAELLAPAGPGCGKGSEGTGSCWKAAPSMAPTKVSYRRKTPRHPDGVSPVRLSSGVAGKPSAKVKARGAGVPMPALPLTPPVTVQLQNGNGKCWQNVISTPALNDTQQFKGTAD